MNTEEHYVALLQTLQANKKWVLGREAGRRARFSQVPLQGAFFSAGVVAGFLERRNIIDALQAMDRIDLMHVVGVAYPLHMATEAFVEAYLHQLWRVVADTAPPMNCDAYQLPGGPLCMYCGGTHSGECRLPCVQHENMVMCGKPGTPFIHKTREWVLGPVCWRHQPMGPAWGPGPVAPPQEETP